MAVFNGTGVDANQVLVDPTGMSNVTATDVQGAIAELDSAGGGGADLAATLVLGNITGANDIVVTSGQKITSAAGTDLLVVPATGKAIVARTTGNARGANAVDLQVLGGLVGDVAAAVSSTIGGGTQHEISSASVNSVIAGGLNNRCVGASGFYNTNKTISGGQDGYIDNYCGGSTIGGGTGNRIDSYYSYFSTNCFVAGDRNKVQDSNVSYGGSYNSAAFGTRNRLVGCDSSLVFGQQNYLQHGASWAFAGGTGCRGYAEGGFNFGQNCDNTRTARWSAATGNETYSYFQGGRVWGAASSSMSGIRISGAAQASSNVVGQTTTTATPARMTTSGGTEIDTTAVRTTFIPRRGIASTFNLTVTASQVGGIAGTVGDAAGWFITGLVKRSLAGVVTLVGAPVGDVLPTYKDAALATVSLTVTVVGSTLAITVTGEVNKDIVWCARVDSAEAGEGA